MKRNTGNLSLVVVLLFLMGCGGGEKGGSLTTKQWQILSYLPQDTDFLLYMNLDELRKTQFWEDYFKTSLEKNSGSNWLTDFEVKTGVGLNEGVAGVYTATTWEGNNLFVIQFSEAARGVLDYFNNVNLFTPGMVNDKKFYELRTGSMSKFYFIDDSTLIVINNASYLLTLFEDNRKSLKDNQTFVNLIRSVQNTGQYFLVTDKGTFAAALFESLLGHNKELPVKEIIASISSIQLSAEFDDGVSIESVWDFNNSKNAYLLSTAIKSALAIGIFRQKDAMLGSIVEDMTISRYDKKIKFTLDLEKEKLNKIRHSPLNNKSGTKQ